MDQKFIKSDYGNFISDNKQCRFTGVNMYELAGVDSSTAELMIKDSANEGFSVIRFWAFEPAGKNKLKAICDIAGENNIKLIPVFADSWGYLNNEVMNDDWYKSGYKIYFSKYISDMTHSFKDREEILLWEIINEPMTDSFESIYNFAKDTSEIIKSCDPNHLVSIGTIGGIGDRFGGFLSRFNLNNFKNLYSLKSLDAVSVHDYSFDSTFFERLDIYQRTKGNNKTSELYGSVNGFLNKIPEEIDKFTLRKFNRTFDFPLTIRKIWKKSILENITLAKHLKKPVYIGEIGFKKELKEYRKLILKNEVAEYFDKGVAGILIWSFESQGKSIDGHGYGFGIEDGFGEVIKSIKWN